MAMQGDKDVMISEKIAPVLVARTLGPFDLVVIFVAIVLFINNAAGVQFAGPSVFIFWIVAFATFLITGAFVTAQLGRMFPEEGSLYVWTHKVLGSVLGVLRGVRRLVAGPDLAGVHRHPGGELPPAVRRVLQVQRRSRARSSRRTGSWGSSCWSVMWFSALDVLPQDAGHAELRERPVLRVRGGDLPDRLRGRGLAAEGQRLGHGLRRGMEPLPGRQAGARASRRT